MKARIKFSFQKWKGLASYTGRYLRLRAGVAGECQGIILNPSLSTEQSCQFPENRFRRRYKGWQILR